MMHLVDVDDGFPEVVLQLVEVSHPDLYEDVAALGEGGLDLRCGSGMMALFADLAEVSGMVFIAVCDVSIVNSTALWLPRIRLSRDIIRRRGRRMELTDWSGDDVGLLPSTLRTIRSAKLGLLWPWHPEMS